MPTHDAKVCAANGYRAVRVSQPHESGPVMAAEAGRLAVWRSGLAPHEIGLVLHAYASHQGRDLWSPSSFVQNETIGVGGPAYELRGGCNGGLSAMELAASYITARPDVTAALVTTGDAFHLPYIDRWTADERSICGDAGAARVLSRAGWWPACRPAIRRWRRWIAAAGRGRPHRSKMDSRST